MAELSVQIGADINDLLKKLKLSEAEFKKLALQAAKSGKTIEQVLKESGKGGKALQSGAVTASKGINTLNKSTANAVPTLTSFSQVIQDAPYGIRGVANNITQLTSQFGYLSKATGGSSAALKAMLGSLAGPAGILFAVSAITSLMVSYGDKLSFAASSTTKLAKATKEFTGDAIAEGVALNQLLKISRDETNSKVVRQGAIDELNKNYGKYLGNLDLESVKTDTVTSSVKNLTLALLQKAKVQGLEALITETTADSAEDLVEAELKRQKALKVLNSEVDKAIKGNAFFNQIIGNTKGDKNRINAFIELTKRQDDVGQAARNASAGVVVALGAFRDANDEVKNLNNSLDNSLTPLVQLQEQFKKDVFTTEAGIVNIDDGVVELKASLKEIEKRQLASAEKKKALFAKIEEDLKAEEIANLEEIARDAQRIYAETGAAKADALKTDEDAIAIELQFANIQAIETRVKELQKLAEKLDVEINFKGLGLEQLDVVENKLLKINDIKNILKHEGISLDVDLGNFNLDQLDQLEAKLQSAATTADVLSGAIGGSFRGMTSDITNAMSTGISAIDGFVSAVLNSLGNLLTQLITQAITQAIVGNALASASGVAASAQGVQIATQAAAALGPAGIIALPGLLAATQAQIVGALALAKVPKFALGGFSGDDNLAYLNKNELVLRPQEQSALYNAIRGHNLGSLANNTSSINSNDTIITDTILRGQNQVIQYRRASKRMNKNFNS